MSDFLREASAVSVAHRPAVGPLFERAVRVLAESAAAQQPEDRGQLRPLPKAAAFLSESALVFAGEVRFPATSSIEPLGGMPRLEEAHANAAGVAVRLQPGGAGFIAGQLVAPVASSAFGKARPPQGPRFSPLVPANVPANPSSGVSRSGSHPKLPRAAHLLTSGARAQSIPDRMRSLAAEPRWKPLGAAIPTRPSGKIVLVFGSFLRRPVPIANEYTLPESFEIRFRPVSFPRYSPRMGILEERPYRTDRIGITPP